MADNMTAPRAEKNRLIADKHNFVVVEANSRVDPNCDYVSSLHRTHDVGQLIDVFIAEARKVLPYDGITYSEDTIGLYFIAGDLNQHRCNYRIMLGEQLLGDICLSRDVEFQDSELAKVENLLAGLVRPLRNALQYQQAARLALRDDLTGLRNDIAYYDNITLEIERARRYQVPFSLLLINLDNFSEINQQYGHDAGNTILVEVARRLEHDARNSDIIFRKGGDEFLVFLPNTEQSTALKVAERVKKSVLLDPCVVESIDIRFTMSIGVVSVLANDSAFKLINRADKALNHAKILGKDRIHADAGPEHMFQE